MLLKYIFCLLASIGVFTSCDKEVASGSDNYPGIVIEDIRVEGVDYFLLEKGETATVKYKIVPGNTTEKSITWKSSNEEVATVKSGYITAIGIGHALITGTSNSNPEKKIEARVRVTPLPVESIKLSVSQTATMSPNEVLQIISVISPQGADQELVWASSNEAIATVNSDGKVVALTPGEVIITASSVSDVTKSNSVIITVTGLPQETRLNRSKLRALPHSSRFNFSPWGTSNLSILWDNKYDQLGVNNIFYIENEKITYFGIDLGTNAKLSSMRFWGRKDNYFALRHPKTIMIYGTNDAEIANNADSPDENWVLLTETPFVSTRPSGNNFNDPVEGDMDWTYATAGEIFLFSSSIPSVRYIRFKCLQTWGDIEGFWATEIAFWGEQDQ